MNNVKSLSFSQQFEQTVKQNIVTDLVKHTISVRKMDGMYRHWRCQEPGTSNRLFDIVTWPGSLCYTGDMGDYLFQRTEDMVAFMRGSAMSTSYAAEKCVAHDGRLKEWREEVFYEHLEQRLAEAKESLADGFCEAKDVLNVEEKIEEIRSEYHVYESEHDAIRAMYESGLWDGSDIPSCLNYTYHFLWCLHAIKWFCDTVGQE